MCYFLLLLGAPGCRGLAASLLLTDSRTTSPCGLEASNTTHPSFPPSRVPRRRSLGAVGPTSLPLSPAAAVDSVFAGRSPQTNTPRRIGPARPSQLKPAHSAGPSKGKLVVVKGCRRAQTAEWPHAHLEKKEKNVFTLHLVVCKTHNSGGAGDPRDEFFERSLSLVGVTPVIDESGIQK